MFTQRIPIVLMGLGWVGLHRHAAAIARSNDYRLIGVIDRNADHAHALGKELGIHSSQSESLGNVPWLGEAKAIAIATPPHSHFPLVSEALIQGLDVLTEKPFAMTVKEGEDLVQLTTDTGRMLAIMHNFQFSRSALTLGQDIASGLLGRIRRIHAVQLSNPRRRLPDWYESLPGGLFYDESPHLLYLMRRFSQGQLALNHAHVLESPEGHQTPELIQAHYTCSPPGGIAFPVTLDMHFTAPLSEWHFSVLGEQAVGIVDIFRDIYIRLPNDGLHTTSTVLHSSMSATIQHWLQHFTSGIKHLAGTLDYGNNEVYRRFAHAIRTRQTPEGIDPASALHVLRMQHAVLSARKDSND